MSDPVLEQLIERRDGEHPQAYQAFLLFATLHPSERENGHMANKAAKHVGVSEASIYAWKKEYEWAERATLIDAHNWLVENQKRRDILSEDNQRFIGETRSVKEESLKAAKAMIRVANGLLATAEIANETIETDKVELRDGTVVALNTTIKMRAKISDIPRLVDTAVKVSRLAAELPTDIVDDDDIVLGIQNLSNLSDEELQAARETNHRKLIEAGVATKIRETEMGSIG